MKLEIEISKKAYEAIKNKKFDYYDALNGLLAIKDGKPLKEQGDEMNSITIKLTDKQLERLAELTNTIINCDPTGIYEDDVSNAISILIDKC